MGHPRSALGICALVAACSASMPPPAVAPAPTAHAPGTPAPTAHAAGVEAAPPPAPDAAPPPAAAPDAPVAMRAVRQARFTVRVPERAAEISPGRWDFGAEAGGAPYGVGISAAPFRSSTDDFIRQEFGRTSLTELVLRNLTDQPGAPGWRAWDVTVPGARTTVALYARFLTAGPRTAFAICVHATERPSQQALCRRALDSLRTGADAARVTRDPASTTFAENEVAVDLPSHWRRIPGANAQFGAGASAPAAEQDIAVFLGANEDTNDLNVVMEGSLAASRARPRTTVEVRTRQTRRVGAESEGVLVLTTTEQSLAQRVLGRATTRDGWAWAVICITPEDRSPATCQNSVASFETRP
ncbi:MAG: hypothetical protein U0325_20975 [Polyangiales bacterium]